MAEAERIRVFPSSRPEAPDSPASNHSRGSDNSSRSSDNPQHMTFDNLPVLMSDESAVLQNSSLVCAESKREASGLGPKRTFYLIRIHLPSGNSSVWRSSADFADFDSYVRSKNPTVTIPLSLPSHKMFLSYDDQIVSKVKRMQNYLDCLLTIPELHPYLVRFLEIDQRSLLPDISYYTSNRPRTRHRRSKSDAIFMSGGNLIIDEDLIDSSREESELDDRTRSNNRSLPQPFQHNSQLPAMPSRNSSTPPTTPSTPTRKPVLGIHNSCPIVGNVDSIDIQTRPKSQSTCQDDDQVYVISKSKKPPLPPKPTESQFRTLQAAASSNRRKKCGPKTMPNPRRRPMIQISQNAEHSRSKKSHSGEHTRIKKSLSGEHTRIKKSHSGEHARLKKTRSSDHSRSKKSHSGEHQLRGDSAVISSSPPPLPPKPPKEGSSSPKLKRRSRYNSTGAETYPPRPPIIVPQSLEKSYLGTGSASSSNASTPVTPALTDPNSPSPSAPKQRNSLLRHPSGMRSKSPPARLSKTPRSNGNSKTVPRSKSPPARLRKKPALPPPRKQNKLPSGGDSGPTNTRQRPRTMPRNAKTPPADPKKHAAPRRIREPIAPSNSINKHISPILEEAEKPEAPKSLGAKPSRELPARPSKDQILGPPPPPPDGISNSPGLSPPTSTSKPQRKKERKRRSDHHRSRSELPQDVYLAHLSRASRLPCASDFDVYKCEDVRKLDRDIRGNNVRIQHFKKTGAVSGECANLDELESNLRDLVSKRKDLVLSKIDQEVLNLRSRSKGHSNKWEFEQCIIIRDQIDKLEKQRMLVAEERIK